MKRLKIVLAFALGIVATALFGACSCKRDTTISVTSLTLTPSVESKVENGKTTIDVVVDDTFTITYNLSPKASTNTKVYVDIVTPNGSAYLLPEGYIFDNGVSYAVKFEAKAFDINNEPTPVEIKFTSDSGNHSAYAVVRIHDHPEVLAQPQNLRFEGGKLVWDAVEHADKYIVCINGEDYTTPSTEFTPVLTNDIQNIINVTAISENIEYVDGPASKNIKIIPLSTPKIESVQNGLFAWAKNLYATNYIANVNGSDITLTNEQNTYNVNSDNVSQDSFDFKVKSVFYHTVDGVTKDGLTPFEDEEGVLNYVLSSDYSAVKSVLKISNPTNLKIKNKENDALTNGILTWNRVSGAKDYTVSISSDRGHYEYITRDTYFDFTNSAKDMGFDPGAYAVTVKSNGDSASTITGKYSESSVLEFYKMDYLSGSVNLGENKLTIDTSSLLTNGFSNELIEKLNYEITFVNSETTVLNNKNVVVISNSRVFDLSKPIISSAEYMKVIIRPYVEDESVTNIANASNVGIIDEISKYAEGFTKLPSLAVVSISNAGLLKVNIDAKDVETFEVVLDDENSQKISKTASFVTVGSADVTIDLTKLNLGFGTSALLAGIHTIKVFPSASSCIDPDQASCGSFAFTKLEAVSEITVKDNKLTWSNISGSFGYIVDFNSQSQFAEENVFSPSSIQDVNVAKITVVGNDKNTINSDTFANSNLLRADRISTYDITNGTLSWEHQSGSKYIMKCYVDGLLQSEQIITTNTFDTFNLSSKTYISVTRRVDGKFDSVDGTTVILTQKSVVPVESIKIKNNDYLLSFENSDSSVVLVKMIDTSNQAHTQTYTLSDQSFNNTTSTIALDSTYFGVGLNYISITKLGSTAQGIGDDNIEYVARGRESQAVEVEVLPAVQGKVTSGRLVLNINSKNNPRLMKITISKDQIAGASSDWTQSVNVESKEAEFDLSALASGNYNVVAVAIGDKNTNVINGEQAIIQITKLNGTSLYVVNGQIMFDLVDGADGYIVKLYDAMYTPINENVEYEINEKGLVKLNTATLKEGVDYLLNISVVGEDNIGSNESAYRKIQKLNNIASFNKVGDTLSWDNVPNNNGFALEGLNGFVFSQNVEADTNSISLPNSSFEGAGKYEIKIVALGNTTSTESDTGYLNSSGSVIAVYKLSDPKNIALTNGVLTWDAYESIGDIDKPVDTVVKITVAGKDTYTYNCGTLTSINLYEKSELSGNGFTITIKYIGNENDILDSNEIVYKDGEVVSRIASTNPFVKDGTLRFNKVSDAVDYDLYVVSESGYALINKNNYTLQDKESYYVVVINNNSLLTNTPTKICVVTIAQDNGNYVNSLYSDSLTVSKLMLGANGLTIGSYLGVDGRLVWDKVENATNYTIYITGENSYEKIADITGEASEYYDISALNLSAGTYYITVRANGSLDTSTSVNYLNSDISNRVVVKYVNDSIEIQSQNDILKWKSVEGVDSYKITITDSTSTQYRIVKENGNNEYNLKNDSFVSTENGVYTISVVPYTLDQAYYLVEASSPILLNVVKTPAIFDLGIKDGILTWKVKTDDLTDSDRATLIEYYEKYRDHEDAGEPTLEGLQKYQKYYHYWNFELVINGKSNMIIPTACEKDEYDATYLRFYYQLLSAVTENTEYVINIRSRGNSTVLDKDDKVITSVKTTISSNLVATPLVAYKTTVPSGVATQNGLITFNLVTTGDSSHPYVQEYYIYAVPANKSLATFKKEIIVSDEYIATSPAPSTYTFNIREWVSGLTDFEENIAYDYIICTIGTRDALATSSEKLYLRSNFYSSITMTFLSSVSVSYDSNLSVNGEQIGAVVTWNILGASESMTHIIYIMPESEASTIGTDWWKSQNVIKISLDAKSYYFDFASDIAKENGILSNTTYRIAAKYGGDERSYITNDKSPDFINVTTLPTVSFGAAYVQNGVFAWNPITNARLYKATLYKKVEGEDITKRIIYRSNTFYEVEDTESKASYSISVISFGTTVDGVNYVNGFGNNPEHYYLQMAKVEGLRVEYVSGKNTLLWDSIEGASSYTITLNETNDTDSNSNSYVLPSFNPGTYTIKVKGNSASGFLNGIYSDAISIVKLYNPALKVENGVVAWSRGDNSDEVMKSTSTVLSVNACDSKGVVNPAGFSTQITLTQEDEMRYVLDENASTGYYKVSVRYDVVKDENAEEGLTQYQLSSEDSTILTFKLTPVANNEFANGVYVDPTDTTTVRDCSFDNYIKWKMPEGANGFMAELTDDEGEVIDDKVKSVKFDSDNNLTGDIDFFAICNTDSSYICYNLARINSIRQSKATIRVTVLGNSTVYKASYEDISETLGYLNSDTSSFLVELPSGAPKMLTVDKGVITWIGEYEYGDEGVIVNEISDKPVNSDVEIHIKDATRYTYDEETHTVAEAGKVEESYIWKYREGADQVFYCPYASSSSIEVKIRYCNSNFVSEWCPAQLITNNALFLAGTGSEEDPYIVDKKNDETVVQYQNRVLNIKYRPNSHFVLKQDVDLAGKTWETITKFDGNINGENHTISNIALSGKNLALFGNMGENSALRNITFDNITLTSTASANVSPIANTNNGTIDNVSVNGAIYASFLKDIFRLGGMVITNNGTITNSDLNFNKSTTLNNQSIEGIYVSTTNDSYVGGFAVYNNGIISKSNVNSKIIVKVGETSWGKIGHIGGIAYQNTKANDDSIITECKVASTSYFEASAIGGIVCENDINANITFAGFMGSAKVVGYNKVQEQTKSVKGRFGGIAENNSGFISNSFVNVSDITFDLKESENYIGLLVGFSNTYVKDVVVGKLSNCYVSATNISLPNDAGFVVGLIKSSSQVESENFENIFVSDTTKKAVGSSEASVKSITVSALTQNDEKIAYILSGINVVGDITTENRNAYNALSVKYRVDVDLLYTF